jgi:4-hydroxybenzoyl-CoA thioesterase
MAGEAMAKTYVVARRLNWGEADPAGTIYAPQAIDFAIQAIEGLWVEALGQSFREVHRARKIGTPWVRTACEFARPLMAGDAYELRVSLVKLGGSSLTYRVVAAAPDGTGLFAATMVSVVIDLGTMRATAIPDDIRTALTRWLDES